MAKKMLIDATHTEETRVAIMNGKRLEDFDFESTTKKQFKGNIYLAKVIRIEPSLQAAFVEYGGNRHGFLPFSEIHPDYYRIPVEDRENLLKEQAEAFKQLQDGDAPREKNEIDVPDEPEAEEVEALADPYGVIDFSPEEEVESQSDSFEKKEEKAREKSVPFVPLYKRYKIQEVVKRRQIMLIQVSKEERGGKGAALTTYLSIAGRYCVLMPNSPNSGGISRKITNVGDRKRLRSVIDEIQLPESMSLIVRTAGMSRTKPEIKRDCDYLTRLWNDIREATLSSTAPCLVYEEGDLIKRSIRDYYSKDIDEILVEGNEGFEAAKGFMKQLMPSHVRRVKEYEDTKTPLFHKYGVESQVSSILDPSVQLKSGGYIVFGTTEALVAIDVNSGKATRERHIDETAFKTNLEAADEVARQLRLRDLAGLVVIDFIDMEDNKHIEAVERRLREAMRDDRARVQIGRISQFGLMELSRQRLRPNIMEATSVACGHCRGTGMVRSSSSSALHVLRAIEEEAMTQRQRELVVHLPLSVGLYILNEKRPVLQGIEERWNVKIQIATDDSLMASEFRIERQGSGGQKGTVAQVQDTEAETKPSRRSSSGGGRRGPYGKSRQDKQREAKQDMVAERLLAEAKASSQEGTEPSDKEGGERQRTRKRGGRRGSSGRRKGRGGDRPREQQSSGEKGGSEKSSSENSSDKEKPAGKPKGKDDHANVNEPKTKKAAASGPGKSTKADGDDEGKPKSKRKSWIKRLLD